MKKHKRYGLVVLSMMWLFLLALCPAVIAFAEAEGYTDGIDKGISLTTKVPPAVRSGGDAEHRKGSTEGLTFTTDDTEDSFQRVLIDDKEIPPESYTVSGEPLTVTMHADCLDALSNGKHTIKIVTANGEASADFTVKSDEPRENAAARNDQPNTGDSGDTLLWTMPLIICSALLLTAMSIRTKRGRDEK